MMPVLLKTVLGLSLLGVPAIASRTHIDLLGKTRAALAQRANVSAITRNPELDSALARKSQEEGATSCACFLKEVETKHAFFGGHKQKFVELDRMVKYPNVEKCAKHCPQECHNEVKHKCDPSEAEEAGVEHANVPMMASKCHDGGTKCKCLDVDTLTRKAKEYKKLESHRLDIATVKANHVSADQCLKECDCSDKKIRGHWSDQEFDHEGLCVGKWYWGWFLYLKQKCPYLSQSPGLVSCVYTQRFKLNMYPAGYAVDLDQVEERDKREIEVGMKLPVATFGSEDSDDYYRKSYVQVGSKGMRATKWQIYKTNLMATRWKWTVADWDDKVQFTINQQRWSSVHGSVWKVYDGTKDEGNHAYYAFGDQAAKDNEEGYKFKFYRDLGRQQYAGKLEHTANEEDSDCKLKVKVLPGEDAGIILMTSVLIDRAYEAKKK